MINKFNNGVVIKSDEWCHFCQWGLLITRLENELCSGRYAVIFSLSCSRTLTFLLNHLWLNNSMYFPWMYPSWLFCSMLFEETSFSCSSFCYWKKKLCFNQAHYYREYADLFLSQTGINHPRSIMFNGQKFTPLSFQLPPAFLIDIISIETGYQLKVRKWIHQLLCLDRGVLKNTLTKVFFSTFVQTCNRTMFCIDFDSSECAMFCMLAAMDPHLGVG